MKKYFIGFVALLVSVTLFAAPRTAEQAAQIAARFTSQPQFRVASQTPRNASEMVLVHQMAKPSSTEPALYVFNRPDNGGFVIVSADDNAVEILGYSEEGTFESSNIPSNVQFMLSHYAKEIAVAQPRAPKSGKKIRRAMKGQPVAPLLGNTQWNQNEPYNNMCPIDNADNTRSYTGCVATAAAQIMRYYEWPVHGEGSKTYTWHSDGGGSGTESVNFANATYDWANMIDKYNYNSHNYTTAQANAVALLMYHVGVASEMQYGGEVSNGSGTTTPKMRTALVNNFKYKSSAQYISGKTYTELASLYNTELAEGRPIIMGGNSGGQYGHEFVCDGADGNGLYHINWGWGGNSDGYFALSGLDPDVEGIGGANSGNGYNQDIDCIIGLEPDRAPVNVQSVTVAPTSMTLKIKERGALTATITPSNASNKGIVWSSSNEDIAIVSPSGVVVGVSAGNATITATTNNGNKTATCQVTVTNEILSANELIVNAGEAEYDPEYADIHMPWSIYVYDAMTGRPLVAFWPVHDATNAIAGVYSLEGQGGYVGLPGATDAINIIDGQLAVTCVGKGNGANSCNTYHIVAFFSCDDGADYKVDVTTEICAANTDETPITLSGDNVGDGQAYTTTWIADGQTYAENIALNNKVSIPAEKPGKCPNGKVFVGWTDAEMNGSSDEAPVFVVDGATIASNKTYYAVYAEAGEGGSQEVTFNTSDQFSNQQEAGTKTLNGVTFAFDKGSNTSGNAPKYYTQGTSVRMYASNTLTISAESEISEIRFTYGNTTSAGLSANTGSLVDGVWNGNSSSVVFTVGAQGKQYIQSIVVTVGGNSYSSYSTSCDAPAPEPVYYDIRFFANGQQLGETQSVLRNNLPEVPANPASCNVEYVFAGWATNAVTETTVAPTLVTNFKATKAQDYFAVYSKTEGSEPVLTNKYKKITSLNDLTTGNYVVAGNGTKAMKAELYNNYYLATSSVSPSSDIISNPAANIVWKITRSSNQVSFFNESINQYVYFYKSGSYNDLGLRANSYLFNVSMNGSSSCTFEASDNTGAYMVYYIHQSTTHEFAAKTSTTTSIYLYKQQSEGGSTTYYTTTLTCGETDIEHVEVAPKAVKHIENGQIVILRGNEKYTIFGQKIQ